MPACVSVQRVKIPFIGKHSLVAFKSKPRIMCHSHNSWFCYGPTVNRRASVILCLSNYSSKFSLPQKSMLVPLAPMSLGDSIGVVGSTCIVSLPASMRGACILAMYMCGVLYVFFFIVRFLSVCF